MPRRLLSLAALLLPLFAACADTSAPTSPASRSAPNLASGSGPGTQLVELRDDCDSASFNAAIGAGTCNRRGSVTFDEFLAELQAKKAVGAWKNNPDQFGAKVGTALAVRNVGGETHTFTRVAAFGGGVVPLLNELSGNPVVAPECASADPTSFIPAGAHVHRGQLAAGTYRFQCCIHPWMRTTVTVSGS